MAKKNSYGWLIWLALAGILVYGGTHGWFKFSFNLNTQNTFQTVPTDPETQFYTYNVNLAVTPTTVCVGDSIQGIITSNIPNGVCSIFANTGSGWGVIQNVNLDASGYYGATVPVTGAGSGYYRAVCCDAQGNCRISNEVYVVSTFCNVPSVCGDTYPQCNGECPTGYICNLLSDHCVCLPVVSDNPQYDCFDSDGGKFPNIAGYCEDSYHQLGFQDDCSGTFNNWATKEWYCDSHGICQYEMMACATGWICGYGFCAQPECSSILSPTSQGSCDPGYCPGGAPCVYYPSTLMTVARCACSI